MTSAALSKNSPVPDDEKHSWRGAFNTQSPAIMRDMFPPAAYATASQQHYGARGEWRVTVLPANQAGSWRNMITGAEGPFFSQMIGVLFNEPEPQALARLVRWDNGTGKGSDQNRLKIILKHDLDNEWQSRWENGRAIPGGKVCKAIRSQWGADLTFTGDTSHVLRSYDQDHKLIALHRDAMTDCPVGLSVRSLSLGADISFGNLTAPIKLHEHQKIENRLNLARDLRTGLLMLQAYRPLWVVQDYAKVELPKGVTIVGMAINRVPGDYASRVSSILLLLAGAFKILISIAILNGSTGLPYDVAVAQFLPSSKNTGEAIDKGLLFVLSAVALGTLSEISLALRNLRYPPPG